jgi:hypothetical protein
LCPRLRADPELAGIRPNHRVAEDERCLARQPQRHLIGSLHIKHRKLAEQLVPVAYRMVSRMRGVSVWVELCPHLRVITARHVSDAALMPMARAHNAGTPTVIIEQPIKTVPVVDQRIDQHKPARDRDSPPGDVLLPTVLVAFVLGPLRVQSLKPPKSFDDLAYRAVRHREKCGKGLRALSGLDLADQPVGLMHFASAVA